MGATARVEPLQRVEPGLVPHQVQDRAALAARDDEPGEAGELGAAPDLPGGQPLALEDRGVGRKGSL